MPYGLQSPNLKGQNVSMHYSENWNVHEVHVDFNPPHPRPITKRENRIMWLKHRIDYSPTSVACPVGILRCWLLFRCYLQYQRQPSLSLGHDIPKRQVIFSSVNPSTQWQARGFVPQTNKAFNGWHWPVSSATRWLYRFVTEPRNKTTSANCWELGVVREKHCRCVLEALF